MVTIDITHHFPVSATEAFTYITDTANWPEYWPDFVRMEEVGDIPWGKPGARVTMVIRLLNRDTRLNIELQQFEADTLVKYISRQQGLPDIHHERHFKTAECGSQFQLVMTYQPRRGLLGLFDRLLLKNSIVKAIHKTLANQDKALTGV